MYLYFVEESNLEKLAMNKKDKKSGISRIPTTGGIKVGPENIKKILFSGSLSSDKYNKNDEEETETLYPKKAT